jgi:hypothetical protein
VPGRNSSVPRSATSSPALRSPNTSTSGPDVSPVLDIDPLGLTVTHTNDERAIRRRAQARTWDEQRWPDRRTGHCTWLNCPGARRPSALATSSSTAIVRVATSTARAMRATRPVKRCPDRRTPRTERLFRWLTGWCMPRDRARRDEGGCFRPTEATGVRTYRLT